MNNCNQVIRTLAEEPQKRAVENVRKLSYKFT